MTYDVYQYGDRAATANSGNVVRRDCWDQARTETYHQGDRQHPVRVPGEGGITYNIYGNATIVNGRYLPEGQDFRRPGDFDPRQADLNYQRQLALQEQNYYRQQQQYQPYRPYQPYQTYQPAGYDWRMQQQIQAMRYQEQLREQQLMSGQYAYGGWQQQPQVGFHIGIGGRHGGIGFSFGTPSYASYYQPQQYYAPRPTYYAPPQYAYAPQQYYPNNYNQYAAYQPGVSVGARFGGHGNRFAIGFSV